MKELRGLAGGTLAGQVVGPPGQGADLQGVRQPGGALLTQLLHPSVAVFDQMYRTLPDDGWYSPTVRPSKPVQFELGAFKVPQGVHLWLMGYEFSVYRQSGVDAGDFIKAEDDRFTGVMGFDLTLDGNRPASLLFQLDPVAVQATRQQFEPALTSGRGQRAIPGQPSNVASGAVTAQFNRSSANSFASTAGAGTALLPARSRRVGPNAPAPFTYVARESVTVALGCVIFRPVPSPLAFIQGEITGYLLQSNASEALLARMRPR